MADQSSNAKTQPLFGMAGLAFSPAKPHNRETGGPGTENSVTEGIVKRPRLLSAVVAGVAALASFAAMGLADLRGYLSAAPTVVAVGANQLQAALQDAPALADDETDSPTVWLMTSPRCQACRKFENRDLQKLQAMGIKVNVIVVAPRDAPDVTDADRSLVANLALKRDWSVFKACMATAPSLAPKVFEVDAACAGNVGDADAIDGYLEWGRASHDRINEVLAANGADLKLPALFWRRGVEWRALVGEDPHAAEHVARDLAPTS
jgi:hypothetical protein